MAKALPYYKMYPADAETDENFRMMGFAERGLYWTLLNHAWLNDGIPFETDELLAILRLEESAFLSLWKRVGKCFFLDGKRLRNKRQEQERSAAKEKSSKATDAVRTRYGRSTNVTPRAYESVSVSISEPSEEKEKKDATEKMVPEFDDQFQEFKQLFEQAGDALMPEDFQEAWYPWRILDFEQRTIAIAGLRERIAAGQRVLHRPANYLKRDYRRPLRKVITEIPKKPDWTATLETGDERWARLEREDAAKAAQTPVRGIL